MTLTNMAIEAGGKNGVCDVDERRCNTSALDRNVPTWEVFTDDKDASYIYEHDWDLATMEPMVAKPHSPDNKDTRGNWQQREARPGAYIGQLHRRQITDMIFAATSSRETR